MEDSWPADVVEFVQKRQQSAYGKLAETMGLGYDPVKGFAALNKGLPTFPESLPEIPEETGEGRAVTAEQRTQLQQFSRQFYDHYASQRPLTTYELPNNYAIMNMTYDWVWNAFARSTPRPFLATLPSGDVNASRAIEPRTKTTVILFEHGLFRYFYDFAMLVGWALPPISPTEMLHAKALRRMSTQYTIPFQASEAFIGTLGAYVYSGTPLNEAAPVVKPPYNGLLVQRLLVTMERFAMAHELTHLLKGHLEPPQDAAESYDREYAADSLVARAMMAQAFVYGYTWAIDIWACDTALTALRVLEISLMQAAFGHEVPWISSTHPDPTARQQRFRKSNGLYKSHFFSYFFAPNRAAAAMMCSMTDALLGRLWSFLAPFLAMQHLKNIRPSPLWNDHIQYNMQSSPEGDAAQ